MFCYLIISAINSKGQFKSGMAGPYHAHVILGVRADEGDLFLCRLLDEADEGLRLFWQFAKGNCVPCVGLPSF